MDTAIASGMWAGCSQAHCGDIEMALLGLVCVESHLPVSLCRWAGTSRSAEGKGIVLHKCIDHQLDTLR